MKMEQDLGSTWEISEMDEDRVEYGIEIMPSSFKKNWNHLPLGNVVTLGTLL
tara:strand:+ start:868 stop:1023 length:156 start_codon:yes stop_codon:yes gene_type:complete